MAVNFPVGEVVQSRQLLSNSNPSALFSDWIQTRFTGFVVLTIDGFFGIEEAVVFFRDGETIGSVYTYDFFDVTVYSQIALESSVNAFLAKHGVFDAVELSHQQVDLVLALDDRIRVRFPVKKADLESLFKEVFSPRFGKAALKFPAAPTGERHQLLKKLGLGELVS